MSLEFGQESTSDYQRRMLRIHLFLFFLESQVITCGGHSSDPEKQKSQQKTSDVRKTWLATAALRMEGGHEPRNLGSP